MENKRSRVFEGSRKEVPKSVKGKRRVITIKGESSPESDDSQSQTLVVTIAKPLKKKKRVEKVSQKSPSTSEKMEEEESATLVSKPTLRRQSVRLHQLKKAPIHSDEESMPQGSSIWMMKNQMMMSHLN